MVQKKPCGDNEKAVEAFLLHFGKGKRLSELEESQCNILACLCQRLLQEKGGQGTIGPLRRFFGNFLSLVKESYSSKTGQGGSMVGGRSADSLPQSKPAVLPAPSSEGAFGECRNAKVSPLYALDAWLVTKGFARI